MQNKRSQKRINNIIDMYLIFNYWEKEVKSQNSPSLASSQHPRPLHLLTFPGRGIRSFRHAAVLLEGSGRTVATGGRGDLLRTRRRKNSISVNLVRTGGNQERNIKNLPFLCPSFSFPCDYWEEHQREYKTSTILPWPINPAYLLGTNTLLDSCSFDRQCKQL